MTPPTRRIGRSMALGAGWMVMMRWGDQVIGLLSTAVLARILLPADYGLVTLAMSFILFLDTVGEFSVELALIRDQQAQRHHYDTAWTINIIKSLVFGSAFFAVTEPLATFMAEPRLAGIIPWLALGVALSGFENIRVVDFRKGMRFDREFVYTLVPRVASTLLTIALAFLWRDYWALVAGILARRVLRLGLGYIMIPYLPRLSLRGFRDIFGFSRWMIVRNLVDGLGRNIDKMILGKLTDSHTVGIFGVSREIGNLTINSFVMPANRAFFPGFAQLASDPVRFKEGFLKVLSVMLIITLPIAAGIGATAHLIVPLFLGSGWLDAVPLVEIITLYGVIRVCTSTTSPALLAANKPNITMWQSILNLVTMPPTFAFGVIHWGVEGGAWAIVITAAVGLLFNFMVVRRTMGIRLRWVAGAVWRPLLSTLAMSAVLRLITLELAPSTEILVQAWQLGLLVVLGMLIHAGVLLGLWWMCGRPSSAERVVLEAAGTALRKIGRRVGIV